MRVFVTGGTGFIGRHFIAEAATLGYEITATCRTPSARNSQIPTSSWINVQLDALPKGTLAGTDVLVHLAASGVSPKHASREEMTYWNVLVTQKLLEQAHAEGVKRVVVAGSFAEYGRSAELYDLIPPDAPLLPTSAYAASKAACFATCHATALELGLEICYLRVFSAFGEGQSEANLWPALRKAALAGSDFRMTAGEQIRDFVDVRHVARSFTHACLRDDVSPSTPRIWNVGSGNPRAIRDFATEWWTNWGARGSLLLGALPYRANEVMRFAPLITEHNPIGGAQSA